MLRPVLLCTFAAFAACLGCTVSEEDACADDSIYDDGACIPKPAASAGSSSSEGGAPAGTDGGAPSSEGGAPPAGSGEGTFGDGCEEHADCGSPTDYCAASPVAPPYCTASGCDEAPDICPEGWSCFDVSQFSPGEPWICMQPLE